MLSRFCTAALLLAAFVAPEADAIPKKYFGQDAPAVAPTTLNPSGAAAAARARFLGDLDNEATLTFTGSTAQTRPPRNNVYYAVGNYNYPGGGSAIVPVDVTATDRAIQTAPYIGTYNTSPTSSTQTNAFLYTVGYYDAATGATSGGVRIVYNPGRITDGTETRPIGAFGVYITDTESFGTIELTLTPLGGGAPVILNYTGIINQGRTGQTPGDGQVSFVGFIDTDQVYEAIDITFTDPSGNDANEAFGFDDLTIGAAQQLVPTKEQVTVFQPSIVDKPGWRLLSAPVEGLTVHDLALQQLVQGVPAGDGRPQQQYPDALSNLYTAYNGGGRYDYVFAPSTGTTLVPGRGFWWYWYDLDINPSNTLEGGGTSQSFVLDDFGLTAVGTALETTQTRAFTDNVNSASNSGGGDANPDPTTNGAPAGTVSPADDDFYMIGNPFAEPFLVSGVSATGGTLQDCFFAWNPGNPDGQDPADPNPALDGPGSYEVLFASPLPGQQAAAAVWQGLMAEVSSPVPAGGQVVFTFDEAARTGAGDPPFHGRVGGDAFVHLRLSGTTALGYSVRDEAAYVRFRADAEDAWDRFDASKPIPPVPSYALLAPVGRRDGQAQVQSVLSLPEGGPAVVSVAFTANEAGTHTLTWGGTALDAVLTDAVTGASVPMDAVTSYTFDTEPVGWTERFSVAFASTVDGAAAPPAGPFVGLPTPNPSAGAVRLDIRLDAAATATVSVIDVLGRRVGSVSVELAAGVSQPVAVPTAGLAPGAYVLLVDAPGLRESRRLTVVR